MDVLKPDRVIGRDLSKGEAVEHELDTFISKRHEQRVRDEGERAVEEAWKERDRLDAARKREELTRSRAEWWGYLEGVYAMRSVEWGTQGDDLEETGKGGA